MSEDRLLVNPEEAAEQLCCSRTKLYELMASKRLKSVRIGTLRRISVMALREFVEQLEAEVELDHPAESGSDHDL